MLVVAPTDDVTIITQSTGVILTTTYRFKSLVIWWLRKLFSKIGIEIYWMSIPPVPTLMPLESLNFSLLIA